MTKVAIIGTVGLPAKYGGFETLTEYLVNEKGSDFDFTVYCSKKAYPEGELSYKNARLRYLPLNANGVQSIPYDILGILHALRKNDSLLILGVSGCLILPIIKIFSKKKIIVNIDGLEWKREKWGRAAKSFLRFSEKVAVKYSDVVIADNKVIQDHVANSYGKKANLIAYGADHAKGEDISSATLNEFPFLKERYAFKVCRIEPENNIELILKAFSQFPGLNLVLVGNWNVSDYSKNIRIKYSKYHNIFLLDPIYDQKKLNELRSNCYIYIHGHSAGGTNPSLVEAMALGLPILGYDVAYNRETTFNEAIYFSSINELLDRLQNIKKQNLSKISEQMSHLARKNYTWKKISEQYSQIL